MKNKLIALIAKLRSSEDTVIADRLNALTAGVRAQCARGRVSPFRYVAPRGL